MPTSYVRLLVAGLTVALAVITGLVTGWMAAPGTGCGTSSGGPASVATPSAATTTQHNATIAPGGAVAPGPVGGAGNALVAAGADDGCQVINPETAIAGFLLGLLTGGSVGAVALFLPRQGGENQHPSQARGQVGAGAAWPGQGEPAYVPARNPVGVATGTHAVLSDLGRPSAGPGSPAALPPETKRLTKERRTLVETCIYVRDRATSKAIGDRLAWALNEVGVVEDRPAGDVFSAARHEAGGTAPTDDRRLDGTIAAVEITGYTDRGQVVRAPVVTVFRSAAR
jgi:hypothetical protein